MKILFFIETLRAGGKERRLLELIRYLKDNTNHEIILVLMSEDIDYTYANDFDIKIYKLRKKYYRDPILLSFRFLKICKNEKPDIVNVWGVFPALNLLLVKIFLNNIIINSTITSAYNSLSIFNLLYILTRFTTLYSNIIVGNSKAGLKSFHLNGSNCKVIYNGINIERKINLINREELIKKYNIKTNFNIIMVASFNKDKDYDLLLDVAKEFLNINSEIGFILVGDGVNFETITNRVKNEKLSNVYLTGKVDYVESLINISNIGILLSPNGEGISNAIMEYMLLGRPVIATDIGGNPEIVKNNINGYLVENKSKTEIVEKILNLYSDNSKYTEFSKNAFDTIINTFNIGKMGKEFKELFEKCAE